MTTLQNEVVALARAVSSNMETLETIAGTHTRQIAELQQAPIFSCFIPCEQVTSQAGIEPKITVLENQNPMSAARLAQRIFDQDQDFKPGTLQNPAWANIARSAMLSQIQHGKMFLHIVCAVGDDVNQISETTIAIVRKSWTHQKEFYDTDISTPFAVTTKDPQFNNQQKIPIAIRAQGKIPTTRITVELDSFPSETNFGDLRIINLGGKPLHISAIGLVVTLS